MSNETVELELHLFFFDLETTFQYTSYGKVLIKTVF